MISLPDGFDAGAVVSAFSELGVYIVSATVILVAARIAIKALKMGGGK